MTATTVALAQACGLRRVVSEVTFTSITLSSVRASDVAPVTSVRLVHQRTPDCTRVTEIHNLVDDLVEQRIAPATAMARLDDIRHRYPRWVVTVFRALLAAAVAGLLGAGLLVTAIAFATTVVDRVTGALSARQLPDVYANAVGAAIATAVAGAVMSRTWVSGRPSSSPVAIVLLLPGVTVVGSVQDAISGFLATASARAFGVFVLTAGIVSGVAAVLSVADPLGISLAVTAQPVSNLGDVPVQALAATVAAAAAAGANYAPRRALPIAGLTELIAGGRSAHSARPGSALRCPPGRRRCCSAPVPTCSPTTRRLHR